MLVTLSGIITLSNFSQSLNVPLPILVTLFPIVTLAKLVHQENA